MNKKDIIISDSDISQIIENLDNTLKVLNIKPIESGLLNPAFEIECSKEKSIILRVFNSESGLWKGQKEEIVYELLKKNSVPIPNILKIDFTKAIIPYTYSLTEKLAGAPFSLGNKPFAYGI